MLIKITNKCVYYSTNKKKSEEYKKLCLVNKTFLIVENNIFRLDKINMIFHFINF